MPPPFKAGLLSFLGQLGIETQQGFNCGLSGWGVLLLLRANPVGSSWLRDLEGTGQLCPAGTSMVLSLAIGGLPSAEDSLPLLASRGKPGLIWSLEQCKQCLCAVVCVFCLFT